MARNIEMNYKGESAYETIYPQNISPVVLLSERLQEDYGYNNTNTVDDVLHQIKQQLLLIQYNKAGVNLYLKSPSGAPIPDIPISGISLNYDGTGQCITDEQGYCFGYCDAGNRSFSVNQYCDFKTNTVSIQAISTQMYTVELTASFNKFFRHTSTTNVMFSSNVASVDVTVVGGGGGGSCGYSNIGGGGGYCVVQTGIVPNYNQNYSLVVGSGGIGRTANANGAFYGGDGGASSFLNVIGNGGGGGEKNGVGNGNGGINSNGTPGTISGYYTESQNVIYGGGGGAYGYSGAGYGGIGGQSKYGDGTQGTDGFGGGGGGAYAYTSDRDYPSSGGGGAGCVVFKINLKQM